MSWVIHHSLEELVISVNMHYLLFLRDIYERKLTFEETDIEQGNIVSELKGIYKGVK